MVTLEDKELYIEKKLLWIIRVGGYLIIGGVIVGACLGVYALLNPSFFSDFISISQYDAMGFFLGICLPSFVITVASGYVFVTLSDIESIDLWQVVSLSILSLLCLALSALSLFNFISFIGSFITLTAVILSYVKPHFKAFSSREACFFIKIGSMFVASFSILFLLMWFVSKLLPSYPVGLFEVSSHHAYALLIMVFVSFFMFFVIPFLCFRDANTRLCGALSLMMGIILLILALRIQYFFFNASVYLGVLMGGVGIASIIGGGLMYVKISRFKAELSDIYTPSFSYRGNYCPYCGAQRTRSDQTLCFSCGRKLMWKPGSPFCPYCGRVVSPDVRICPHCQEPLT